MDRSALDYAYSLEGEHTMRADKLRREAFRLETEAKQLRENADREDERAAWARTLALGLTDRASDETQQRSEEDRT